VRIGNTFGLPNLPIPIILPVPIKIIGSFHCPSLHKGVKDLCSKCEIIWKAGEGGSEKIIICKREGSGASVWLFLEERFLLGA